LSPAESEGLETTGFCLKHWKCDDTIVIKITDWKWFKQTFYKIEFTKLTSCKIVGSEIVGDESNLYKLLTSIN
jgi:hypothetical protein